MKFESTEQKHEKPKGPSIEGLSKQAPESTVERTKRVQSMEKVAGKIEDFDEGISIEVAMGKDMEKRPGSERGEDMFLADKETGLTGVFDGLGGSKDTAYTGRGADASGMAAQFAPSLYKVMRKSAEASKDLGADLTAVIAGQASLEHPGQAEKEKSRLAKEWGSQGPEIRKEIVSLYNTVQKLSEKVRETGGMTTVTLGKTIHLPDGRMFEVIANVGDSGAMRVDAAGEAEDVTKEDSAVDYLLSRGAITPEQARNPDYEVQPGHSIKKLRTKMYQALGAAADQPLVPRISVIELQPGDRIVYATDGVRDEITNDLGEFDPKKAAEMLGDKGAEHLMNEAGMDKEADKRKRDEKTVLIKERFQTAELLTEEDEEEIELDQDDIIEAA